MPVNKLCKTLLLALPLCLLPGWALGMVYQNGVISGLQPNTVVELVLPSGDTSSATVSPDGELQVTRDEDDDDPAGLYIAPGTIGVGTLRDQASGEPLGDLNISDYVITVASVAGISTGGAPTEGDLRFTFELGVSNLSLDTTANNTANGRMGAEADGFATVGSADDDATGFSLGLGLVAGDGRPWTSRGSHQWKLRFGYNWFEDFEGQFRASQPGLTIVSSGESETSSMQLSAGYEYFIARGVGLSASIGWERFDTKDTGTIVRVEDSTELSSFSESEEDTIGFAGVGLSFWPTERIGLQASYRYGFSDVGGGDNDSPSVFGLDVILTY